MYKSLKAPLNVQLEITTECTQNCGHCYNFWRTGRPTASKNGASLPPSLARKVMRELAAAEVFEVTLTGGEPLLCADTVMACVEEGVHAGMKVSLNSNLFLLSRTIASQLKSLGLKRILTTILAPTAEVHDAIAGVHGAFDRVVQNVRAAIVEGITVTPNMVVSRENCGEVVRMGKFVSDLGLKYFAATKAGCPGNCDDFESLSLTPDLLRKYLEDLVKVRDQYKLRIDILEPLPICALEQNNVQPEFLRRKCAAGITTCTIACNGDVRPCSHLDVNCGNVNYSSIADIWMGMLKWRNGTLLPAVCRDCSLVRTCGGGCRMEARMYNGFFDQLDPYCRPERAVEVIAAVRAAKRLYRNTTPDVRYFQLANPRLRKEDFGATVASMQSTYVFLSNAGVKVFEQFKPGETYSIDDSRIDWGPVAGLEFVRALVRARVAIAKG